MHVNAISFVYYAYIEKKHRCFYIDIHNLSNNFHPTLVKKHAVSAPDPY